MFSLIGVSNLTANSDTVIKITLKLPDFFIDLCFGQYFSNLPTVHNLSPDPNQEF
jgi:hypothetical protein